MASGGNGPDFHSYEKMTDSTHQWIGNLHHIKKWVVLEKIHGANFSLTVWSKSENGKVCVRLARRTAFLQAQDKFFKIEQQLDFQKQLKMCAENTWELVKSDVEMSPIESIVIYGELFGGYYPHPSVKNDPYVAPVQKEVAYCPETRFCAFDIAITRNGEREYMDYDKAMSVLSQAGFMYSKPMCICTLEEALSFDLGFVTPLPTQFGLPPVADNLAEGIVIKPLQTVAMETEKGMKRVIFKRKIEKFSERRPLGPRIQSKKKNNNDEKTDLLKYEMYSLVTEQRLINTISKLGQPEEREEDKWREVRTMLIKEVKDTLQEENEELWEACLQFSPIAMETVMKEIEDQCFGLIEMYRTKNDLTSKD